jgi:hypothetical protein
VIDMQWVCQNRASGIIEVVDANVVEVIMKE